MKILNNAFLFQFKQYFGQWAEGARVVFFNLLGHFSSKIGKIGILLMHYKIKVQYLEIQNNPSMPIQSNLNQFLPILKIFFYFD